MLNSVSRKQCNAENGRKALAIAKKLANANTVNKQHGSESDKERNRSIAQGNKDANTEDIGSPQKERSAKASFAKICNKMQEFERNHPEAVADLQKFAMELGRVALKR